jgi:hypothetical protein
MVLIYMYLSHFITEFKGLEGVNLAMGIVEDRRTSAGGHRVPQSEIGMLTLTHLNISKHI